MRSAAVLFLLAVGAAAGGKLVYVTVLFRHGDRSPVKAYPTDPYQESAWPQGFGQLSQEGMRQHFELGRFLRNRYKGFLNESYDRHEVSTRRAASKVFTPDLKWQPIPVHTVPQSEERLLSYPLRDCPRYKQLMNETEHTEEFLNITTEYQDILDLVKNKTGTEYYCGVSVERVRHTLL
ncbi:Lysosomal acid phosphatase [Larimichthys crocea]|uniref:Uncharacterized protein n=1 Tax=Larimichthys crocea TaxID=215358 RepID=A0ACD3QWV4_LARCR|nr:Lysosomal acid phosphatase [Larimichthys crocea]